jgi:hypothetical protein
LSLVAGFTYAVADDTDEALFYKDADLSRTVAPPLPRAARSARLTRRPVPCPNS